MPLPLVRGSVVCYVPSHWKRLRQDEECTLFECEGLNDLLLHHSLADESHEPEEDRLTGVRLLNHRVGEGFEGLGPVRGLKNGFEVVCYRGQSGAGRAADGSEHYCEIVGYVKPKTRIILCYQTILPDDWRYDCRWSMEARLLLRSAALTRSVNPIEAQWFQNPRLAPKGFLDAPFVCRITDRIRGRGLR